MAVAAAMVTAAAKPILTFSSSTCGKQVQSFRISSSSLVLPVCRTSRSHLYVLNPRNLGSASFSAWSGLKHMGIYFKRTERKGKWRRGLMVHASLFGVGAPEALVIGVVALLVFGPKGLAELARTLGKTLRAFQPTIRELQDVSREFKSTLEREIGLDEVQSSLRSTYTPSPPVNENSQNAVESRDSAQPTATAYSSEDLLKITVEQLASSTTTSQLQETSATDQTQTTEGKVEISSSNAVSSDSEPPATQEESVTPIATPEVADATPENKKSSVTMAKSEATAGADQDPNVTARSS